MIRIALPRISRKVSWCSIWYPSAFKPIHTSTSRVFVNYGGRSIRRSRGLLVTESINCLPYSHKQRLFSSKNNNVDDYYKVHVPPPLSNQKLYVLRFYGESKYIAASASCGIVLYDTETSKVVWKARMYFQNGESTQEAEYFGITRSLEYIVPDLGVKKLIIQGDERGTVLNQLKGIYQISNGRLKYSNNYIKHFLDNQLEYFEVTGIPAGENSHAKKLAKKAFETKSSSHELCLAIKRTDGSINDSINIQHNQRSNYDGIVDSPSGNSDLNLDLPLLSSNNEYVLRFDGGSRGNPGVAGCGIVIFDAETQLEVWCAYKYLDKATNNVAEYTGLLEGLKFAKRMGVNHLIVEGDSKLVVNQIEGVYKVKKSHLKPIYNEALSISKRFRSFKISYIPREENFRADQLANFAMDKKSSSSIFSDHYIDDGCL